MDFFRPENFFRPQKMDILPSYGLVRRARTHTRRAVAAFFPPSFHSIFGASWRYSR